MSRTMTLASALIGILIASSGNAGQVFERLPLTRSGPSIGNPPALPSLPGAPVRSGGGSLGAPVTVSPETKIPGDYKSWSLFLICNPKWILDKGDQGIADLFKAFKAFGDAIGEQNAAVWFWKDEKQPPTVANTDISRMSSYCQKYHLLPSQTPQVVTTTTIPDGPTIADRVVLNLGTNASDSASALAKLTDQLLKTGLNQAGLDEDERWSRFIAAGTAAVNSVGCYLNKVSLSFNIGVAKVEIAHSNDKGCKPSG